jgi:hypothetical protein
MCRPRQWALPFCQGHIAVAFPTGSQMGERVTATIELIIERKFVLSVGKDVREAVADCSSILRQNKFNWRPNVLVQTGTDRSNSFGRPGRDTLEEGRNCAQRRSWGFQPVTFGSAPYIEAKHKVDDTVKELESAST